MKIKLTNIDTNESVYVEDVVSVVPRSSSTVVTVYDNLFQRCSTRDFDTMKYIVDFSNYNIFIKFLQVLKNDLMLVTKPVRKYLV
ncbi:MAG: hypothetical protein NC122_00590 [Faecalibacterium sp.]|nr:hypothetical protein [Ruminococcus sp.]MCM1392801.1 hypothetical protein [Ruminococcus sp.]MCM1484685.1 hypothetical protein [Faecalibacterium sp.]